MNTICEHFAFLPMNDVLKSLFSSATRVKLLSTFLLHPEQEYFVRELTRLLDEQINSIRRELENLKRIGLVKSRTRNRKKYFRVNPEFPIYPDLRNLFGKAVQGESAVVAELKRLSGLKFLVLAGSFVGESDPVDILIVGDVKKADVERLLRHDPSLRNIKYSIFSAPDFLYRLNLKDKFIHDIVRAPTHVIAFDTMTREIEEAKK
jgi:DNA-binding transcriptional ArsR family regulator